MARSRLGYSPALDGVRGLFMLCFMAFHFGVTWLTGARVGINLFFVLSAFLITRLLVEEKITSGGIDAIAFYTAARGDSCPPSSSSRASCSSTPCCGPTTRSDARSAGTSRPPWAMS
uniref:Uncharacterized protein n=1 Tax=Janibacter limosus TaxID=53458 RepID=A0AC61U949_9MICO|nr:hypothetical protein [Janibacter limosus]